VRFKSAVVLLLIVVLGTTTFPVTGQEEPLPAIQAKGSLAPLTPTVVLPSEPIAQAAPPPTLEAAARANDFVTFDQLYRDAVRRGDSAVAAYAPLHELWTYGITDPIGAFYGADLYERLARAYPGYASFIAEYRIVDNNGNVFYPTSETRAFLLDRALEGRAPGIQLTEARRTTPRVLQLDAAPAQRATEGSVWDRTTTASSRRSTATKRSATTRSATTRSTAATPPSSTAAPQQRTTTPKHSGTQAPSPVEHKTSHRRSSSKARTKAPVVATKTTAPPTKASTQDVATSAGGNTSVPSSSAAAVPEKAPIVAEKTPVVAEKAPVEKTPVVVEPSTTSAEAPTVVRAEPPAVDTAAAPQPIAVDNKFGGRGILLLVIGMIGVGLLAMMLRAPREVPTSIMQPPPNAVPPPTGDKPSGPTPVEPLRRPSAAPEPPSEKNRASGSHG
jgi:hypothetical protein